MLHSAFLCFQVPGHAMHAALGPSRWRPPLLSPGLDGPQAAWSAMWARVRVMRAGKGGRGHGSGRRVSSRTYSIMADGKIAPKCTRGATCKFFIRPTLTHGQLVYSLKSMSIQLTPHPLPYAPLLPPFPRALLQSQAQPTGHATVVQQRAQGARPHLGPPAWPAGRPPGPPPALPRAPSSGALHFKGSQQAMHQWCSNAPRALAPTLVPWPGQPGGRLVRHLRCRAPQGLQQVGRAGGGAGVEELGRGEGLGGRGRGQLACCVDDLRFGVWRGPCVEGCACTGAVLWEGCVQAAVSWPAT